MVALMLFLSLLPQPQDGDRIQQLEERIRKLEEQNKQQQELIEQVKRELQQAKEQQALTQDPKPAPPAAPASTPSLRLIDIALDLMATGGASTVRESELRGLQGGGHDPKNRGFTIQNTELTLSGVVDPYLRGDANIVLQIDEAGETVVELEEVYLTTLALPANLQVKAGEFYTTFGRLNAQHPHAWDFADQPVVNSRFMGPDGLRNPGVQVSWLAPLPFFAELTGSIQNAQGETAVSFRGEPGELVAGHVLADRDVRAPNDMLSLARIKTSFDPTDEITLAPGASALFGPNGMDDDTQTGIYGLDLYAKWKPLTNDKGWPFVAWQTEAMTRRYESEATTLDDWGAYSQVIWGFARPWTFGFRHDVARGEDDEFDVAGVTYDPATDPLRDRRRRESLALTYYPSEFSKLRLQYAYDRAEFLDDDDAHSIYLQFEIIFGAHGAHKF